MAGTVSDDSSAGAAIDDGLPPLPGVKPDPG
jgi:hypothetical protein